jgi:acetyltransferase
MAIVAEMQKERKRIIGVALLTLEPGGKRGEFAVLVGDQWQGLGLGSKLLDSIIEVGREMALKMIYGYVISENRRMIDMCTKKGFRIQPFDSELFIATLELS